MYIRGFQSPASGCAGLPESVCSMDDTEKSYPGSLKCKKGKEFLFRIITSDETISAADKEWRVYPLDPLPDAVALYSRCTPGKRRAWFLPDDRQTAPFAGLHDSTLTVTPLRSLNCNRGVISEPDLLTTPEAEILDGFSDQVVIQVRRITIKKDATVITTKHLVLTFNSPNLPATIKAGYLNCKIRLYIPNPLRCYKCQRVSAADKGCRVYTLDPWPDAADLYSGCTPVKRRAWFSPEDRHTASLVGLRGGWRHARTKLISCLWIQCCCARCQRLGHSQTSCRGQLTCSRCASAGNSSTDCTLEPKCVNCPESHSSDSKLHAKWKFEKDIQEIKIKKNISYLIEREARELIVSQSSQTYAQVTKPTAVSTTTQTDPNITNIIYPPLQCLTPVSSISSSIPVISTSSSTQAYLLLSTFAILPTIQSETLLPITIPTTSTSPGNRLNTSASSLKTDTLIFPTTSNKFAAVSTEIQPSVSLSELQLLHPSSLEF
ncbi:uncharacterized protein TNCV_1395321 [Trichonephila clavipes]|nr:uncharacterized protein TNCV_1395321 [Trichonephila clavipes]